MKSLEEVVYLEFVTYTWIKDENHFQYIETLIFVQHTLQCREEGGLSRASKSEKIDKS